MNQQIQNPKSQTLEQFIEANKTQYGTQKGIIATQEYLAIIQPYVNIILDTQKQLKETIEKLPKKQRVKVIKANKQSKK